MHPSTRAGLAQRGVVESREIPWRREPNVSDAFLTHLRSTLAEIDAAGLTKRERLIAGPQGGAHQGRRRRRDARDAQPLRQQLSRPRRSSRRDRRRQGARSTNSASAWPRCASSAARRPCIANSSWRSRAISARTTRSCSPPVSTPTAACSSRCSLRPTRSSPTRSITLRSSTACASPRRAATATPIPT